MIRRTVEASVFEIIGIRIVLQQFGMSPSGETTERTAPQGGVVRCRSADEAEFV